jgi:trimeric autotransporter adhesin
MSGMRLHLRAPRGQACPGLARLLLCAALVLGAVLPQAALAGTPVSLFNSFAGNINFVTTGNTLRANDNTVNACTLLSGLNGAAVNAGTSSGTVSGIPAGSSIVAAYLYYAGSSGTVDSTITFNGSSVTANRTFTDTTIVPFFGGFVDVTSLVAGNGSYSFTGLTVNNTNTYCGNSTVLAGWALVVIYSNNSEAYRVVNIYDGFQAFQNNSITLTPANFKVPNPPLAGSKFAVITWEGDPGPPPLDANEVLKFNGTALSDGCNTTTNQYNSTIDTLICTGNAATDDVFYGVDIDTFGVDSYVSAGQTSATTFYQSGQDAVMLAAQIISITDAPVSDLSISKVHNGNFGYGDNGSYTITVTNNGPTATSGTTTVADTLPAGETYVSATGTGWSCSAVGQVVTCTSTAAIANGASFNPITLTVAIATSAGTSLVNTATVTVDASDFDNNSGNNSSTDTVSTAGGSLVHPDLSTSTKDVFNPAGGDYNVGGTVQYTITLNESAGVDAGSVSVADTLDASLTSLTAVTVTGSSTTPSNTSTSTALAVSNITVPANGSVTIVFKATVKAGTANCAAINNTGTVTYAGGSPTTDAVTAPTIIVAQSSCTTSGNKILYVYDNLNLTRVLQTANGAGVAIAGAGGAATWTMTPVVPAGKNLVLTAGNITASLIVANTNSRTGNTRTVTVELLKNSGTIATSGGINITSATAAVHNFTITIPATTIAAGDQLIMVVHVASGAANRDLTVYQKNATTGASTSTITFATSTVINVDSVTAYNAAYPATTQTTVYSPGTQVFICANISDPFGNGDVSSATITLKDASGTTQVSAAAMTDEGATNCTGTASTGTEAFEYAYTLPTAPGAAVGNWTASVTGNEGSEGTVTHTANGSFEVNVPALLIVKSVSVSADTTGNAIKHSLPGATMQYAIQVQNTGRGTVDSGTLVISDPVPTNTILSLPAKPPFTFTDGSTSSGLSVSANDGSIAYSNNGGGTYTYTPSCTRPCTDAAITNFKITLNGAMNGKTGATAPSFTITYNVVIQ